MDKQNSHISDELLAKYFSGEANADECKSVEAWAALSSQNKHQFEAGQKIWLETALPENFQVNEKMAWDNIKQRIAEDEGIEKPTLQLKLPKGSWAVAASVLFVISFGLYWVIYLTTPSIDELTWSASQPGKYTLPDGSIVTLNEGSNLHYRIDQFNKNDRAVVLEGEAYFEVMPNHKKTFMVHSGTLTTKVLGTKFLVRAYEKNPILIAVTEGKVGLFKENKSLLELTANQQATFDSINHTLNRQLLTDPNLLYWKTKTLIFDDQPLGEIAKILSEKFNLNISLSLTKATSCQFTSTFSNQSIEEILDIISTTHGLSWRQDEDGYTIYGAACGE